MASQAYQPREPDKSTLFHLVPVNAEACQLLNYSTNQQYLSQSRHGSEGLEVGYHVSKQLGATVITRIGRNADLLLLDAKASKVHVEFQFFKVTSNIVMKVNRPRPVDVTIGPMGTKPSERKPVTDIVSLSYGDDIVLLIRDYEFRLVWRLDDALEMRSKAQVEYHEAVNAARDLTLSLQDTVPDRQLAESYYLTRIQTGTINPIKEDVHCREVVGAGAFSVVYKTLDMANNEPMAVKVFLIRQGSPAELREQQEHIHQEADILKKNPHHHIIEFLHITDVCDPNIRLYMPWRDGSLKWLVVDQGARNDERLKDQVFHHILKALDFLACQGVAHRDVKPDNILCTILDHEEGVYRFQLADFGLSRYHGKPVKQAGTLGYVAPETVANVPQGSKVDIWALGMTLIWLKNLPARHWPFDGLKLHSDVVHAVLTNDYYPEYEALYREDQGDRASAAQCLDHYFLSEGRTTMDWVAPIGARFAPVPDTSTSRMPPPRMKRDRRQHRQAALAPSPVTAGPSRRPHRQAAAHRKVPDQKQKQPVVAESSNRPVARRFSDVIMGGTEESYNLRPRPHRG